MHYGEYNNSSKRRLGSKSNLSVSNNIESEQY